MSIDRALSSAGDEPWPAPPG